MKGVGYQLLFVLFFVWLSILCLSLSWEELERSFNDTTVVESGDKNVLRVVFRFSEPVAHEFDREVPKLWVDEKIIKRLKY